MALQKDTGDSFTLAMSLAEMAFFLIFVLMLLFAVNAMESPLPGDSEPVPDPVVDGAPPTPPPPDGGSPLAPPDDSRPTGGGGPNSPPRPSEAVERGNRPPPPPDGGSSLAPPDDSSTPPEGEEPPDDSSTPPEGEEPPDDLRTPPGGARNASPPPNPPPGEGVPPQEPATPGFGLQPCWKDAEGNIEFLFRLVIDPDSVSVERMWPEHRDAQAQVLGAPALVKNGMSRTDFETLAGPIREWSDEQEPACRHYFVVHQDDVASLALLLRAEDFMYKLIERFAR